MSSVNRAILIGHLGRDPETRYTQNGDAVCTFSIATSENWKNKNGERVERTEWHNIVLYKKLAEIAQQYLAKGKQIYIEGSIRSRKYQDKNGVERTVHEIIGNNMTILSTKDHAAPATNTVSTKADITTPSNDKTPTEETAPEIIDDLDDDIPF